jgi:hypothetical protein
MTRLITRYVGLLAIAAGALMMSVPALAYIDTAPGSGGAVSASSSSSGGSVTFTATFSDLAPGTVISFSSSTCTVTFSPTSAALNASHQASTTATFGSNCAGQTVTLTATAPGGAQVLATVAIAGGFPNTSAMPVPIGWLVMAFGAALILVGIVGAAWRRQRTVPAAA